MGYEHREAGVRIVCRVSRHNSARDRADDALVDEIRERVRDAVGDITKDPRYADLISFTEGLEP
jgi:hypothetical protein